MKAGHKPVGNSTGSSGAGFKPRAPTVKEVRALVTSGHLPQETVDSDTGDLVPMSTRGVAKLEYAPGARLLKADTP